MIEFETVANVDEFSETDRLLVEVNDRIVIVVKVEEQFFCIDDVCTHDGGSFDDGQLNGHVIACPRHGATFDVRTGAALSMPATKATGCHEVQVVDGDIQVRLTDEDDDDSCAPDAVKAASASRKEPGANAGSSSAVTGATGNAATDPAGAGSTGTGTTTESAQSSESTAEGKLAGELPAGAAAGSLTEDRCREELKKVIDPELFVNIVDLGLIYTVTISDAAEEGQHNIAIDMTMTSPMCPAGPQLIGQSKQVLMQLDNVADVEVKIVMDPPWTPDKMTDEARDQLGIF